MEKTTVAREESSETISGLEQSEAALVEIQELKEALKRMYQVLNYHEKEVKGAIDRLTEKPETDGIPEKKQ